MKTIKRLIPLILLAVIIITGGAYLQGKRVQKAKDAEITQLKGEKQTFLTLYNSNKEIVAQQKQTIVTLKMAKEALLIDLQTLRALGVKNTSLIVDLKTEVARLKLEAQYNNTPQIIHDTVWQNGTVVISDYLKVPQPWKYDDPWLNIAGTVKTTGVTIDSLKSWSEPKIVLGSSRKLFNSDPIVVYTDKNPHTTVKDMSNIVIINKPPLYKRPGFYAIEGVITTLAILWGANQLR